MLEMLDMRGAAQRSHYVLDFIAWLKMAEASGAGANGLYHEGDCAASGVGIGYRQGYALAVLVDTDDDEMAGTTRTGYQRGFYYELEDFLGELLLADYLTHYI